MQVIYFKADIFRGVLLPITIYFLIPRGSHLSIHGRPHHRSHFVKTLKVYPTQILPLEVTEALQGGILGGTYLGTNSLHLDL